MKINNAYITQGCVVDGEVNHSVLFTNSIISEGAKIYDSVIMNNAKIGKSAKLYRCLVADDVRIPDGMILGTKDSKEILLVTKKTVSEGE